MNITIDQINFYWNAKFKHENEQMIGKIKAFKFIKPLSVSIFMIYYNEYCINNKNIDELSGVKNFYLIKRYVEAANLPFNKTSLKPFKNNLIVLEVLFLRLMLLPEESFDLESLECIEDYLLTGLYAMQTREKLIMFLIKQYKEKGKSKDNSREDITIRLIDTIFSRHLSVYDFTYSYINDSLFVSSKFDNWYLELFFYNGQIDLYHRNKKFNTENFHFQKTFNFNNTSIENVISYIDNHDKYLMNDRYNYDKFSNLLKMNRKIKHRPV